MNITRVIVHCISEPTTRLLGYARVIFDSDYMLHDLKIVQGKGRLFVAMPTSANAGGTRSYDVFHPVNPRAREALEKAVLDAYAVELVQKEG